MPSQALLASSESVLHGHRVVDHEKYADINWDELEFGVIPTDYMYIMKCSNGDDFLQGHLIPYGNIELTPSAGVLNYGQGLFEGLKANRMKDGRIQLFRPEQNALRMKMGAERLCMPSPSVQQFLDAVTQTVLANKRATFRKRSIVYKAVAHGKWSYSWSGPAPEYTFLIYTCPVRQYVKYGTAMNLCIENEVRRATPGGTGGVKSITNYSPVFEVVKKAKASGFNDVLFLDAATGKNIEELSTSNIFVVKGNVILTPPANGTILPGITRKSIIEIALQLDYKVEERDLLLEDVLLADEVFCTGTAMSVTAVGSITHQQKRVEYRTGEKTVFYKLGRLLTQIQTGLVEDKMGWTVQID